MKKIIFSLLLMSSLTYSQTEKSVGDFTKVTAFDKIDVQLIASTENKVVLNGPNAQEVELINKNGELKIRMPFTKFLSGDGISATVYYKKIDALEANEGSRIASNEPITTLQFSIICKEGASIKLTNLETSRLHIKATSGALVTVSGNVQNQDVTISSGAIYSGEQCFSEQTIVVVTSGGEATIHAKKIVDATTKAGGKITIHGKPNQITEKKIAGGIIEQF